MFAQIFKDRRVIAKHRLAPFAEERESYLRNRQAEGYSSGTLRRLARQLLLIARTLKSLKSRVVTSSDIADAAKRWARRCPGQSKVRQRYVSLATKWCNELGWLKSDAAPATVLVEGYLAFLHATRGLASKTIVHHRWYLTDFLNWFTAQSESSRSRLDTIVAEQVDQFFIDRCSSGWSRPSAGCAARVLRSFFRYAYENRLCKLPVADSILSPRIYGEEKLPAGPSWQDVVRLVEQMEVSRAADIRDKAIILLCAVYGFRSSEVCQLKLDDLDWEYSKIRIWRPKQMRRQEYPLLPTVGEAIIKYLQLVRPRSRRREVFLLLAPPHGCLSAAVIYAVVRNRYAKLGIVSRKRGPHSLRHACAARLVEQGFSLKEVGDHLGHRCSSVTRVYAKVDIRSLQEVAKIVEEGVL